MRVSLLLTILLSLLLVSSQSWTAESIAIDLKRINSSPLVSLMLIYDTATEMGPMIEKMMQQIKKNKQGYLQILFIDCNKAEEGAVEQFMYCAPDIRKQLPALIFTEPALNQKNPQTKQDILPSNHQYQGTLAEKNLYDFALPLMKAYSHNIHKMSEWIKLQEKFKSSGIPIMLHCANKKTLSPFYKALTANFRNNAVFAHALPNQSGENPICKQLGVDIYPALLLNGKQPIKLSSDLKEMIKTLKKHIGQQEHQIFLEEASGVPKNEINAEQMKEKVYEQQQHILVHIAGSAGEMHSQWNEVQKKFKNMFTYYQGEGSDLLQQTGVKKVPAIVYYPKSLTKKQIQKTIFPQRYTYQEIYKELTGLVDDFTVPMASDLEMQQLTGIALKDGRLVAVLFHSDQIPLPYKMLSNRDDFKEYIIFFRMKDPSQSMMKKFQVTKMPALFIMTNDQSPDQGKEAESAEDGKRQVKLKLAQFTGKFNYEELTGYFSYFVKPKSHTQTSEYSKQVTQIKSNDAFKKKCLGGFCYLLLLNGVEANREKNANFIKQLQKISSRVAPSDNLAHTDAACHSELLQSLQIQEDQLPTVVYINSKLQKYTRLIGRVEEKALMTMAGKVKINKVPYRAYNKLAFEEKDCKVVHTKMAQMNQGSSQLNEEETAMLQEIKEQQKYKKRQAEEETQRLVKEGGKRKQKKNRRPKKEWENQSDL